MPHAILEHDGTIAWGSDRAAAYTTVSPAPRDIWRDLLARDRDALVTQSPDWIDCLCRTGQYRDSSLLLQQRNSRSVVLPMVRRAGVTGPVASLSSMPASWGVGGLVSPDGTRAEDVAQVIDVLASGPLARFSIRPNPLLADAWSAGGCRGLVRVPRRAHVLDLSGGFDTVWTQRFHTSTRNRVRRAERAGITVECDTTGRLLPVFFHLFDLAVARWARMQHEPLALARLRARRRDPRHKFQAMVDILGDRCRFWYAWVGDQPVAAILVLQDANASYTRGAMDEALVGNSCANYLLHRLAIEDACRAGCRTYHMGETGDSKSLAQFKSRFGANATSYSELQLEVPAVRWLDRTARTVVKRMIGFKDV